MAKFEKAYEILKRLEYSSPSDALHINSGEKGFTWMGIYEEANPSWSGWKIIKDELAMTSSIKEASKRLYANKELQELTAKCYKTKYWDLIKGDEINSQSKANEVFVFVVNALYGAIKTTQRLVGVEPDGVFGAKTLKAINAYDEAKFDTDFDAAEIAYYEKLIAANPKLGINAKGWRNRASAV